MESNTIMNLTQSLITPEHLRRKAFIYLRQSSPEQVEKNTGSQAFQRSQFELAQAYGWPKESIEIIEDDLGISARSVAARFGWQEMLEQIAANAVGAVFAVNVSRLNRQKLAFEQLLTLASYHGVLLFMDNRVIDPRDPNDTVMSQIAASFAEYENKKRTEHMSRSRMAKAKAGSVVSSLPVGWIRTPDGKYDYDPESKDSIRAIIDTFMQVGSIRQTVKRLTQVAIKIPSRRGGTVNFVSPSLNNVRRLLINPAYAGTYVFGKTQSERGGRILPNGQSARVKVPEHLWIKQRNFLPAYMSEEQQAEIKRLLKDNHFVRRNRPGRGHALTQGLLRCAVCGRSLCVNYHRGQSYSYGCGWESEPCTRFVSYQFDGYVLAEVFKVLKTPPLEMLQAVLEESRRQERDLLEWIAAERERLTHMERRSRDDVDRTRERLPRVHFDALQKLENVLQEREEFKRRVASEQASRKPIDSDEELQELCRLVSDVPALWHHKAVTHQERKEILRCLVDHIVVAATREKIDATIAWTSGQTTALTIWRGTGRYNLVSELHAQGLTVFQIQERLAAGMTSTAQVVKLTIGCLYEIHRKLGLTPNRFSAEHLALREKALTLNREGRSIGWVAENFNEQGYRSASGKAWTRDMIYGLLRAQGENPISLEETHREAITEARARGLSYQQMAVEFNERGIRRRDGQPWTARDIKKRWGDLNRLQRKRAEKGSETTELSEPVILQRSA